MGTRDLQSTHGLSKFHGYNTRIKDGRLNRKKDSVPIAGLWMFNSRPQDVRPLDCKGSKTKIWAGLISHLR